MNKYVMHRNKADPVSDLIVKVEDDAGPWDCRECNPPCDGHCRPETVVQISVYDVRGQYLCGCGGIGLDGPDEPYVDAIRDQLIEEARSCLPPTSWQRIASPVFLEPDPPPYGRPASTRPMSSGDRA